MMHRSHISPCLHCHWARFCIVFPIKRHESWARVILLLGSGLGFGHKETTETHSALCRHPSSDKRRNLMCHASVPSVGLLYWCLQKQKTGTEINSARCRRC
jgi:hypothetical protein